MVFFTVSTGIAKLILFESSIVATLIPITSPVVVMSGPPELPGLIAASVCMMPVSF